MIIKALAVFLLFVFQSSLQVQGQYRIAGVVTNATDGNPVSGVHVLVWDQMNQQVRSASHSSADGRYSVMIPDTGYFELRFSILGYKRLVLRADSGLWTSGGQDVSLVPETYRIEEVTIAGLRDLVQSGDTIRFLAESFSRGDEQVLKDLLSRIPGFQVMADGTVKVGQQEVEKIMIEGDDLFNKGYQILSNGMPVYPIQHVELLKNYSHNRLLRGIENSDKIALNLTLKKDYKMIWFGNIHAGWGYSDRESYEIRPQLMNFGKINKFYLLADLNNTGRLGGLNVEQLGQEGTSPFLTPLSGLHDFYMLDDSSGEHMSADRGIFNRSMYASLNAVLNPASAWKITARTLFSRDVLSHMRKVHEYVDLPDLRFHREESYVQRAMPADGMAQWTVEHDLSDRQRVQWESQVTLSGKTLSNAYVYGLIEGEEQKTRQFLHSAQRLNYSNKVSDDRAILVDLLVFNGVGPQRFSYEAEQIKFRQSAKHQMDHYQLGVRYLYRISETQLLDWRAGYLNQYDRFLVQGVEPGEKGIPQRTQPGAKDYHYESNRWYSQAEYHGSLQRLAWSGRLKVHQNRMSDRHQEFPVLEGEDHWQLEPGMTANWKFNAHHRLAIGYTYSSGNRQVVDMIPDYVQTGFRSAARGLRTPGLTKTSTWTLSHYAGDWMSGVFVHTMAYLMQFKEIGQSSIRISPDFTWLEYIWVRDPYLFSIQTTADYFVEKISSNVQVELSLGRTLRKGRVNSLQIQEYFSSSYNAAIELRSGLPGPLNFHIGWKLKNSRLNTSESSDKARMEHQGFVDGFFEFPRKNWHAGLKWEWYYFKQEEYMPHRTGFLDLEVKWEVSKNKWNVYLIGENLSGVRNIPQYSMSEQGYLNQFHRIVPRTVLLRIDYRF